VRVFAKLEQQRKGGEGGEGWISEFWQFILK